VITLQYHGSVSNPKFLAPYLRHHPLAVKTKERRDKKRRKERADLGTSSPILAIPLQKSIRLPFLSLFPPNLDVFLAVHGAPMFRAAWR